MGKRRYNPRLAKIHRNYTMKEISNLYGIHKNTVREWIKNGLQTNDDRRPILILGSELRCFLEAKRTKHKRKCLPHEIYCVRCRAPQQPAENIAEYVAKNDTTGRLIGICPICDSIINKYVGIAMLEHIQSKLDISLPKLQKHINESV